MTLPIGTVTVTDGESVLKGRRKDLLEGSVHGIARKVPAEMGLPIGIVADGGSVLKDLKLLERIDTGPLEEVDENKQAKNVFGREYVIPEERVLTFHKNGNGDFRITYSGGEFSLSVRPCGKAGHKKQEIVDEHGVVIALLKAKHKVNHKKWIASKGKGHDREEVVVFSAEKENKFCLNVCLGDKMSSSDGFDYQIKGTWKKKNSHIYAKGSTAIAEVFDGTEKDKFMVKIYPNVDYVSVVALVVIADAIQSSVTTEVLIRMVAAKLVPAVLSLGALYCFSYIKEG